MSTCNKVQSFLMHAFPSRFGRAAKLAHSFPCPFRERYILVIVMMLSKVSGLMQGHPFALVVLGWNEAWGSGGKGQYIFLEGYANI